MAKGELDDHGRLVIAPSKACEASEGAVSPADAVAGLHAVLGRLLALGDDLVSPDKKPATGRCSPACR